MKKEQKTKVLGTKQTSKNYEAMVDTMVDTPEVFSSKTTKESKDKLGYQTKRIIKAIEENEQIALNLSKNRHARSIRAQQIKSKYSVEEKEARFIAKRIIVGSNKFIKNCGKLDNCRRSYLNSISESINLARGELGYGMKPMKKFVPTQKDLFIQEAKLKGFDLCTPALIRAYETGVLTKENYNKIKIGGFISMERYSDFGGNGSIIGVKNCYRKLEELFDDRNKKIVIKYTEEENLKTVVAQKLEAFKSEQKRYYSYYANPYSA